MCGVPFWEVRNVRHAATLLVSGLHLWRMGALWRIGAATRARGGTAGFVLVRSRL